MWWGKIILCIEYKINDYIFISVVSADPTFVDIIPNVTVAIGRDAVLQCTVDEIENYKVVF